jgi:hypothetical protein
MASCMAARARYLRNLRQRTEVTDAALEARFFIEIGTKPSPTSAVLIPARPCLIDREGGGSSKQSLVRADSPWRGQSRANPLKPTASWENTGNFASRASNWRDIR